MTGQHKIARNNKQRWDGVYEKMGLKDRNRDYIPWAYAEAKRRHRLRSARIYASLQLDELVRDIKPPQNLFKYQLTKWIGSLPNRGILHDHFVAHVVVDQDDITKSYILKEAI